MEYCDNIKKNIYIYIYIAKFLTKKQMVDQDKTQHNSLSFLLKLTASKSLT
jgi:hypothetical protein